MKEDRKTWQIHAMLTIVLFVSPDVGDRSLNAFWQYSGSREINKTWPLLASIFQYFITEWSCEEIMFSHRGSHVAIIHNALDLTVHGISLDRDPQPPASDIWWPSQETCSNLFTSGSPPTLLASGGYLNKYGQCKWAVCTLLECFLVWELFLGWTNRRFLVSLNLFIL